MKASKKKIKRTNRVEYTTTTYNHLVRFEIQNTATVQKERMVFNY